MIDTAIDTNRITAGVTSAAVGYASATVAAFTEMMTFGFDMWSAALSGFVEPGADYKKANSFPDKREPAFGLSPDDWCGLPWLDAGRITDWTRFMFPTSPSDAFAAIAGTMPLRGSYAAWPVAKTMIDNGVPRSIAWPAAEANAAALDATEAAVAPLRRVFATAHSPMGFAMSTIPVPSIAMLLWAVPTLDTFRSPFG